jgi:hypothetical protein
MSQRESFVLRALVEKSEADLKEIICVKPTKW